MRSVDTSTTEDAFTGTVISAAFALAWTMWGSSGVTSQAAIVIRIIAVAVCAVLVGRLTLLRRGAERDAPGSSMFSSPAFRRIVVVEVIALFGGGAILGATGESAYTIAWFALVVGVHFLCFGQAFWTGFHLIGVVLIVGALGGAVTGLAGGTAAELRAVTGLTAAADLFATSAWTALTAGRL